MPTVSVIMSVYNGEEFLQEAVDSILAQTFSDFEFIIVDDGSTDRSGDILNQYKDERIKLISQKNIGLTKSLNKAIKYSKGEYIARMDADDISLPRRLEKQVDFLKSHPDIGLVGTSHYTIDSRGTILDKISLPTCDKDLRERLIKQNTFCHPTIMTRTFILDKIGIYNEDWRTAQDYEFYFRVIRYYKVHNLAKPLLKLRLSLGSVSVVKSRSQLWSAIRAQAKAISEKQYPWYKSIYIIKHLILWILPQPIKRYL